MSLALLGLKKIYRCFEENYYAATGPEPLEF
jgi:hypothetical protein